MLQGRKGQKGHAFSWKGQMPYLQVKCFEMALKTSIWDYYTTKKASYALQRPYKPFKGQKCHEGQKFERRKNLTNVKLKGFKNVTKIGFNVFFHLEIFQPS